MLLEKNCLAYLDYVLFLHHSSHVTAQGSSFRKATVDIFTLLTCPLITSLYILCFTVQGKTKSKITRSNTRLPHSRGQRQLQSSELKMLMNAEKFKGSQYCCGRVDRSAQGLCTSHSPPHILKKYLKRSFFHFLTR